MNVEFYTLCVDMIVDHVCSMISALLAHVMWLRPVSFFMALLFFPNVSK